MPNSQRRANALIWLLLSAAIIALDQWTKSIALSRLAVGETWPVIDGFLNWTLAFNTGAAFSFLADAGGWQRWGFSALALFVSGALVVWLARTPRGEWRTTLPLAFVVGGAIGNLIDRLRQGHVTDFIQVYHQQWYFPAFNVADSAICVGAVMLAMFSIWTGKNANVAIRN